MKSFLDKTQNELSYLMLSPSNPLPPREPPPAPEEIEQQRFGPLPSQSLEEIYGQNARQPSLRENLPQRPLQNHVAPPMQKSLPLRLQDTISRQLAEQQPLPQNKNQEWSSAFQMVDSITDEPPVTKINHTLDSTGREVEQNADKEQQNDPDAWDFNESASFPEPEPVQNAQPQRPDQDLFPIAQEPPKSPGRPNSQRRKGSMSRRKSEDLALQQNQKNDTSFKVRFGLRGHLDAVGFCRVVENGRG